MSNPAGSYDVIVIGAGAAGMMTAITAGKRGLRVVVLEHNERVGKKIAISGGGRCNFTNLNATPENYLSGNPDFCRSALARYTPWDFVGLVEEHGIAYHEKKLGQQFCDTTSREIIDLLRREADAAKVEVRLNCRVHEVAKPERFRVSTSTGELSCTSLVVATGGLSFPKLGASDLGYRIGKQFGLKLTSLRPGLVPLTWRDKERELFQELSGVALPVIARHGGQQFPEALLFTHRGVSGPAVLQISSYWKEGETLDFDLLPEMRESAEDWLAAARGEKAELATILGRYWPKRMADAWCQAYAPAKPVAQWKAQEAAEFAKRLRSWSLAPGGTEGYAKAEVTLGGIDTGELSSKTMEARKVQGLFFVGEVVDVTGWLGGYNFQWAWASGFAAGGAVR